jgi:signal transduction histidine kinase
VLLIAASLAGAFVGLELLDSVLHNQEDGDSLDLLARIGTAVAAAGLIGWFLRRRERVGIFAPGSGTPSATSLDAAERDRQHVRWFVQMRWIAASVILVSSIAATLALHLLPPETLLPLLIWWTVLVVANAIFSRWAERAPLPERQILIQVAVDLVVLTGLLNASGGIENPLYITYLFHVIIGGILLPRRRAYLIAGVACVLFTALALGEFFGLVPHRTIVLFPHEYTEDVVPDNHDHAPTAEQHASHDPLFVIGRVMPFVGVLVLSSYLTTLVTERLRQNERELERQARQAQLERRRLEGVVDTAGVGMILVGPDLSVQWFSRRAADWLDWDQGVIHRRCPIHQSRQGCSDCLAETTFRTGQPQEAERTVVTPDGTLRYLRHATSPVFGEGDRAVQVVELIEDVTARRALEAEALHASKLSLLGRMAAGIAHEIGNPLSSLSARLKLMERRNDSAFTEQSLALLRSQIDRMGQIVHGVLQFARPLGSEWSILEANGAVHKASELVALSRRAKHVELKWNLVEPSPHLRGVEDQIVQVLLNLLLNAIEATPDGGSVNIATFRENGEVAIAVSDTGVGMDESVRAKIFEPFFTTKEKGTGLGLSISYSLVHAHGGRIEVTSEPGSGSRFVVWLPAASPTGVETRGHGG